MQRRIGVLAVISFVALSALPAACGSHGGPPRPNLLLISIDSLRADHLSCYGYARETSPSIDRLAAEGALFTRAISSTSWTLPAHASMFTGLPSSVHGCTSATPILAPQRRTVAETLSEHGYRTAGFWSGPYLHPVFGLDQGFAEYESCANFDFYETSPDGEGQYLANTRSHGDVTNPKLTEEVVAWLRRTAEQPFFLFVHMWDVHYDYIPPAPYDALFDPDYAGAVDGRGLDSLREALAPRDLEHLIALYDGEIAWTDHHVGRILDALDETGLRDDTVVILTADHGEEFFEHGRFGHRKALFEESILVPLIVRFPKRFRGGQRNGAVVSIADLAPTLLDLAGAAPWPDVLGQSLVPVLEDSHGEDTTPAVSELIVPARDQDLRVLRAAGWKLLLDRKTGEPLGYWDLTTDPEEHRGRIRKQNQIGAEARAVLERVTDRLEQLAEGHALETISETVPLPEDVEQRLRDLGYIGRDE